VEELNCVHRLREGDVFLIMNMAADCDSSQVISEAGDYCRQRNTKEERAKVASMPLNEIQTSFQNTVDKVTDGIVMW